MAAATIAVKRASPVGYQNRCGPKVKKEGSPRVYARQTDPGFRNKSRCCGAALVSGVGIDCGMVYVSGVDVAV